MSASGRARLSGCEIQRAFISVQDREAYRPKATPRNDWIDAARMGWVRENTDEHGWRFGPHGWVVMRASVDPELDGLTERIIGSGFAVAPAMASSDPLKRRFIRAAQSAIRVHPCQENHGLIKRGVTVRSSLNPLCLTPK